MSLEKHRPHAIAPQQHSAHVVLAVKNFAAIPGVCHIGLGVTASNTAKVLRREGYWVDILAAQTTAELETRLNSLNADLHRKGETSVSHVVISAPSWVQPADFHRLVLAHPQIDWVMLNHSGCAYLSIDKYGIKNNRELIDLQLEVHNFFVAANNPRVGSWLDHGLGASTLHLPNLYDINNFVSYPAHRDIGGVLRVGSFGAGRPWKNQLVAAEASVQLAKQLGLNLELYVNSKRPDGGERMIESRKELFSGLRGCKLIDVPWESWPAFRRTVGNCHLMMQPSVDETFNVITADGIAVGVASVVTSAIEWAPDRWKAMAEDPGDLVRVALYLLHDKTAVEQGRTALKNYTASGLEKWKAFLGR